MACAARLYRLFRLRKLVGCQNLIPIELFKVFLSFWGRRLGRVMTFDARCGRFPVNAVFNVSAVFCVIKRRLALKSTTVLDVGVPMEFNLLRRYDQMDRQRQEGSLTMELLKGPNTNFSASYRFLTDKHDQNLYGRFANRSSFVDAQFTHIFPSGAYLYASYSREMNRYGYRDLAHLLPNPPAPPGTIVQGTLSQFALANTWERTSRNDLDSFEFGVNVAPQEGKLLNWQFDLAYALSYARDRISTTNPFIPRADSILHAGANPYPDVIIRRHNVNLAVTRRISEKYEIGARYWYEPYNQDDFSFNVMQPYVHGTITSDAPKYLFQDARYGTYHANVASVFVRYSF